MAAPCVRGTTDEQAASSSAARSAANCPNARRTRPGAQTDAMSNLTCPARLLSAMAILMSNSLAPGLYIVAGPIGNLSDLSPHGAEILREADVVAVEDTRVSAKLLRHAGSDRPMVPYHDHSDERVRMRLIERMANEAVALLSDAGTPLISDPGYKLVRDARAAGRAVNTAAGPCAAIAAITLSGLPSDRFLFMGFLPNKTKGGPTRSPRLQLCARH